MSLCLTATAVGRASAFCPASLSPDAHTAMHTGLQVLRMQAGLHHGRGNPELWEIESLYWTAGLPAPGSRGRHCIFYNGLNWIPPRQVDVLTPPQSL